ncbi:arginyl-tRNA-protein transferase [Oceanicaulis sp. HTCC2633]|uniref:arginyltransferase n=1 Tax=unclassified Oceanicaulis TaxID=2632123 RepID=UPI000066D3B7|nr:arginyl-tRNA-protein transferase [Oceanicaulis sp. HTCC2633]
MSVTRPFATRQLPFFLTAPTPCPYLEGRMERKIFTRVDNDQTAHLNNILTHAGFRRSQSILYRPACELCSACKSARIPVADFEPSRTQRRVSRRNADLLRMARPAEAMPEQFALLSRYLNTRHGDGDMAGMDFFDFASMVEDGSEQTELVEYRDSAGQLIACVLVDRLIDGFSLVYSFFAPERAKDSLGAHIILDHVERAKAENLPFVYLGYWVQGSPKMDYKAQYKPLEVLEPEGWRILQPPGDAHD